MATSNKRKYDEPRLSYEVLEDVQIILRNFSGRVEKYNAAGNRNFGVILDDKTAERMAGLGWRIKFLDPKEEDETPKPWIKVAVSFKYKAPRIVLITGGGRTNLDEDNVGLLDLADIETVDVVLEPYNWTVEDESGVKAYLKTMYVTINEDPIEAKYRVVGRADPEDGVEPE